MLALACDYRIINSISTLVCIPVVHLGLVLPDPLISLARAKISAPVLRSMLLEGIRLTGVDAVAKGIVDDAASSKDLKHKCEALANALLQKPKGKEIYALLKEGLYRDTVSLLRSRSDKDSLRFVQATSKL
jgi:enoyl-CoA hydratase/carnithine racemase